MICSESARNDSTVPARSRASQPAWLQRLWHNQAVPLGPEKLYWWGIQVQSFLAFVREQQLEGPVDVLVSRFLNDLRVSEPPLPVWRIDQARQALEVFIRGTEDWHWEPDQGGQLRPRFRLKAGATAEAEAGVAQATDGAASKPVADQAGRGPVRERGSWRERLVAAIRLRNYSLRTEEAYAEWVTRFLRYHGAEEPELLGQAEVREFLEYLAVARQVSASTQNQAFSALLFLYQVGLDVGVSSQTSGPGPTEWRGATSSCA